MKQLKKLGRGYQKYLIEDNEEETHEAVIKVAKKICYTCTIGSLEIIDLGNRYLRKCTNCDKRTKSKPKI
jgi:hypothetical protein